MLGNSHISASAMHELRYVHFFFHTRLCTRGLSGRSVTTLGCQRLTNVRRLHAGSGGFELRHWPSAVVDFYNDDLIRSQYYPETAELVRAACGAEDVFVFQHMRRDSSALNKESGEEWSYVYDIIMP